MLFVARVSFSVAGGTFAGVDTVNGVTLVFNNAGGTEATVDYLILGHKLKT